MSARFVIEKSSDGQYLFNLEAGNGEVILTSERYKSRRGAMKGIESVRMNSPIDARYERRTSADGRPYFVLEAANREIIGRSELYSSEDARDRGIESVKSNGATPSIADRT